MSCSWREIFFASSAFGNFGTEMSIQPVVRYWGFLLAKLLAGAVLLVPLLSLLNHLIAPGTPFLHVSTKWFGFDLLYTSMVGLWFLMASGILYLCIWDQRYRCRVCLRRLRMPIETGSWSLMLQLGRPRIEYICPYGHGKLNVEELQILGRENPEWTEQRDMWEELLAGKGPDSRK